MRMLQQKLLLVNYEKNYPKKVEVCVPAFAFINCNGIRLGTG